MRKNQQLICIINSGWVQATGLSWLQRIGLKSKDCIGPKFDDIVTVAQVNPDGYLWLVEYNIVTNGKRNAYDPKCFAEIMSTFELESELHEIFAI